MIAATSFAPAVHGRIGDMPMPRTCVVRLIDRRTGSVHRINGTPLTVFTRNPRAAADELLQGRDPALWEARIEPIEPEARK